MSKCIGAFADYHIKDLARIQNSEALNSLAAKIEETVNTARHRLAGSINSIMVKTYWEIGRYIVEDEQGGNAYAQYGKATLSELSKKLSHSLGRGFSRPNLSNMRKFFLLYPICQTVSDKLGWSHICELITKYELYLPNKEELQAIINETLDGK